MSDKKELTLPDRRGGVSPHEIKNSECIGVCLLQKGKTKKLHDVEFFNKSLKII